MVFPFNIISKIQNLFFLNQNIVFIDMMTSLETTNSITSQDL
jgi:hypothetical protein